jgi:subtilisin family serine protease
MTQSKRLAAWVAVIGLLVGTIMLVLPIAMQRSRLPFATVDGRPVAPGEVLVKFRRTLASFERSQFDQQTDADRSHVIGGAGVRRLHSRRYDTATLLAFLRSHPDVAYAEPNYLVEADATPNDPSFFRLWGLLNTGQVIAIAVPPGTPNADIGATLAWDVSTGSAATVVAVIDTGILSTHPDLAANIWSAPSAFTVKVGGKAITCDAGTHGFNAIAGTCDPLDDNGHGTHVSGTIGAVGNNRRGVAGVNWTTSIMAVKALGAGGVGTTADAIDAIEFVIQAAAATGANVRVLNGSWSSGGFSQALLDEINKANDNAMLFVAAAGNTTSDNDQAPSYPASFAAPNVVAVASTKSTDVLANDSNYGATSVDLAAPGVNIYSTSIAAAPSDYTFLSGTSSAAAHVSGAAALVLSRCALDTAALKANLLAGVDHIPALTGRLVTGGRLNVNASLRACLPTFSLSATPSTQTTPAGSSTSFKVSVAPSDGFAGTVDFSVSGLPAGATANFTPPSVTSSGSSELTVTSSRKTPTGSFLLTITGTGEREIHTATVTLAISEPTVSTNVASNNNPSTYGAEMTFTATVIGSGVPTGTVTFMDGTTTLGSASLEAGGQATWTTSSLTAGTHSITAVYGGDDSFDASTSPVLLQTVDQAVLTVTADRQTKVYGAANPAFTASYSGFVLGETLATSGVTGAPSLTTTATPSSRVGDYPIVAAQGTLAAANYTFTSVNGTLTVTKATLTLSADAVSRAYGAANPEFTASFSGFVNGETLATSGVTGAPGLTTTATPSSRVGDYPIVAAQGTLAAANYTFTSVDGTLTVTKATLTLSADAASRAYGAANPEFTASFSGFVNGETLATSGVTGEPSLTSAATPASRVGDYLIAAAPGALAAANYSFAFVSGTLTITPAPLTITASNPAKTYGQTVTFAGTEFAATGLINGDTVTSVTLTSGGAAATAPVAESPYAIVSSAAIGTGLSNYTIRYASGTLTVTQAALTVAANNETKVYGAANPPFGVTYVGFVNSDTRAILTTPPTLVASADAATPVGTYAIVVFGAAASNYAISFLNGVLTVGPAPLTIVANNQGKWVGEPVPTLTATYQGLVNRDTPDSLQPGVILATTASPECDSGTYPITVEGAANPNYTITFVSGVLTVAAIDQFVSSDGGDTVWTPAFSTSSPHELLVAFAASDGPASGVQTLSISGAGLTWQLVRRVNAQSGTSEIWTAIAEDELYDATVASVQSFGEYHQSLTVVAFAGVAGIGATGGSNGSTSAPRVLLTTTLPGSRVFGVGNDWDNAIARTVDAHQTMLHEAVDTGVNDTFWVQATTDSIGGAGTQVQLADVAPANDQWNFAAVEIVIENAGATPAVPAVDRIVFVDDRGTLTTPAFDTFLSGEVIVAFVGADGPEYDSQSATVSGAGLAWTLVQRANSQAGTAEIWTAIATTPLSGATVTSELAIDGYHHSLTIVAFTKASGIGASASASAANGAPALSLSATAAGSLVYGVGHDWDTATPRSFDADQLIVHQWVETESGDTFWVQTAVASASTAGATMTLSDTAPTDDRTNVAIVEIVP